jgi:hypothetical protein
MPIVLSTVGFGGVPGCGRVARSFLPVQAFPELFQVLAAHRGFKPWPHGILLIGDVLAAGLDELL